MRTKNLFWYTGAIFFVPLFYELSLRKTKKAEK